MITPLTPEDINALRACRARIEALRRRVPSSVVAAAQLAARTGLPLSARDSWTLELHQLFLMETAIMEKNTGQEKFTKFLSTIPESLMPVFTGIEDLRSTFHRLVNIFAIAEARKNPALTEFEKKVVSRGRETCELLLTAFDTLQPKGGN